MIKFLPLDKDVYKLSEYFKNSPVEFCDLSTGVKYMWRDMFKISYAFFNDTLLLKEDCPDYTNAFYFPIGKDVDGGLNEIENYVKELGIPLKFCCIDNERASFFTNRYPLIQIYNDRNWSDYIYNAKDFLTYSGKKFSGQRNHVNKFKNSYRYTFTRLTDSDLPKIKEFLEKFNSLPPVSPSASYEREKVFDLIENCNKLNQLCGILKVDGNIVGVSVGEIVKNTLIIHVEKADINYSGAYPTLAQEFAKEFINDSVVYINREEDCGDMGLRKSKLQYHPIEIKEKNIILVKTLFNEIVPPVIIKTERLEIKDITENEKDDYYLLSTLKDINLYYGNDFSKELETENESPEFYFNMMKKLKEKEQEYSLGVFKGNKLIGEIVLWNFDYKKGIEIGFRFLPEFHGKGYGIEGVKGVLEYIKTTLNPSVIKLRAHKDNLPSINLINKLNATLVNKNDTHLFFEIK